MNKKVKRTNVSIFSIKSYLLLFLLLLVICGGYSGLFMSATHSNSVESAAFISINMIAYILFISLSICIIFYIVKRRFLDIPVRKLQNAAQKIANGDFSVRVTPYRKDGKKDEIEVLYEDFNKMVEELASTETLKTDFISSVSHEIKTPIAIIENYASYLQSEELTESERLDYMKTIVQASQKLSGLVNDILSMNKLEHLGIIPKGHPYSLDEQIRRCVVLLEDLWSDKEITFSADLEDVTVTYDESLLEIIWNNLISNAVKFTDPSGEISIILQNKNDYISVSVSDTGCGIDDKYLHHIFDKFYQGDTSHSKEGNGLGLAMVKKICDICNGKISVESIPGVGSTFTVILKK